MLRLFPARRCLYQSLHHTFARARTSTFPTLATSLSRYIIDSSEPHLHSQAWLLRPNPAQGLSTLSEVQSGTPQASEEELEHGDPDWQDTASSSDLHLLQHQEAEQSGGWYSQVGSPATEELASTGSSQYSAGPQQAKFSDTYEEGQRYSSINELGYLEDSEDSSSVPCSGSDTLLPKEIDVNYRSPTELLWPETPKQRRFGSKVHSALQAALLADRGGGLLTGAKGFTIEEVRMEPDLAKAFILWDSFPSTVPAVKEELRRRTSTLRHMVAKNLQTRRVPLLEFRHRQSTEEQETTDSKIDELVKPKRKTSGGSERQLRRRMKELQRR